MKIKTIKSSKTIAAIAGLVALFMTVACTGQGDPNQQDGSPTNSKTTVKPPKVDIHTAVVNGNLDALQQHIDAGTDINKKDPYGGSSPLITAALFDKQEMANLLIEAGADLNFQNNEGSTALITAAFFGRLEIVSMLLDQGADKSIKNKYGATAYESVAAPFGDVKSSYDMMGKMLEPMGLKLDYDHLKRARPEIAAMLK